MQASAHLVLDNVSKHFEETAAIDHVSLAIPRGSFTTLLGPSGCGKTTTLRMIAGFYEPDSGSITLGGRRIDQLPAHQRGTAMVFQDYALFPHMTVYDNVAYGLKLAKVGRDERERRVAQTLDFVGLGGLARRWPNQLSGGQQQRVALARALIVEPEVLLLDEPLSNLDANLRERMRWELRELQQRLGITFLYVTHDQEEALAMSDWIAVMREGKVEQWGTPWEIYHRPRSEFMAQFVGAANLLPATVVACDQGQATVAVNGHTLVVAEGGIDVGQEVLLCIRPEAVVLAPPQAAGGSGQLTGQVTRSAFLGATMRYWVQVDGQEWVVDQANPTRETTHSGYVSLWFAPDKAHVIPTTPSSPHRPANSDR